MKLKKHLAITVMLLGFTPFAAVVGSPHFEVLTGDTEICGKVAERLGSSVQIINLNIPTDHQAGQDLKFNFTIEKKEPLNELEWVKEYSDISINSIITKPYTKFVRHKPMPSLIHYFFSADSSKTFEITTKVPKNIGGSSQLRLSFFLNSQKAACLIATKLETMTTFHSKKPDIIPPLIRNINFDKGFYRPGELVTVRFQLTETLNKSESDHIEFVNREIPIGKLSRGIPKYGPVHQLKDLGQNLYEFSFVIPVETVPGKYYPSFFNRQDNYGNFEGAIGERDIVEKEITERSPLLVGS